MCVRDGLTEVMTEILVLFNMLSKRLKITTDILKKMLRCQRGCSVGHLRVGYYSTR